jgi:murein L,D-transpeptidase YcbB/YkuD
MHKTTVIDNGCTHRTDSGKAKSNLNYQQRLFRYFLMVLPFALILLISTSYQQNPDEQNYFEQEYYSPEVIDSLKNFVLSGSFLNLANTGKDYSASCQYLRDFYSDNRYRPVWIHYKGLSERGVELISLFERAREYGLEPGNYHIQEIRELKHQMEILSETRKEVVMDFNLEILLSDAAFRFMINLHSGYQSFDSLLYSTAWVIDLHKVMLHGLSQGNLIESILSVEPVFIEYIKLRSANALFVKTNALNDQVAQIHYPNRDTIALTSEIKEALIMLGYVNRNDQSANIPEALRNFQRYHGLTADGRPGLNTIEALGKSTLYRYRVLALNLDRLRKKQYGDSTLLYVNIPSYRLKVFNRNILMDTLRVIVGNPSSPTPLFSGKMERIIANPMWYVPKSIAINEMLPKIKADSTYLERNGFRVLDKNYRVIQPGDINLTAMEESEFNYTFRQNRGAENSLGLAKFIFTNPHAIYIHDTPGKSMFSKDLRAFSHGCIRVEHPERLANYILDEINADTTDFSDLMTSGLHHEFNISSPMPVHITYVTCEADELGGLYFYKDIYGIDQKELAELAPFMGI